MVHALLSAITIGAACAWLGIYAVHRRMSFAGDALAHATLPGLAVAFMGGFPLMIGALAADLLAALGMTWAAKRTREDAAIGVVFTGMFALGVVLLAQTRSYADLTHLLFGNLLAISSEDLRWIATLAAGIMLTLAVFQKELALVSCDPGHARTIGLSPLLMRLLLLVLLAMAVVAGSRAVGVVLTSSLLIAPAAAALQWSRRLRVVIALAIVFSILSAVLGLYGSYYLPHTPGGAAVVVANTAVFIGASLLAGLRDMRRRRAYALPASVSNRSDAASAK